MCLSVCSIAHASLPACLPACLQVTLATTILPSLVRAQFAALTGRY
jgi:hypothetical protein